MDGLSSKKVHHHLIKHKWRFFTEKMPGPGKDTQFRVLDPPERCHRMLQTKERVPVTSNDQSWRLNLRKMTSYVVGSIPNIGLCGSDGLPSQSGIILSMMENKAAFQILIDLSPGSKKPPASRNGLISGVVPHTLEDKGLNLIWRRGCKDKGHRPPFAQAAQMDGVESQGVDQFAELPGSGFKVSLLIGEVAFRPTVSETIVDNKGEVSGKGLNLVFPGLGRPCAIVEPNEWFAFPMGLVIYGSLAQFYFRHRSPRMRLITIRKP
jgi:hypothetical protein